MPEKLTGPDGKAIDIEEATAQFNAAMASPPVNGDAPPDYPAPPRKDPDAPFGRDDKGEPIARYGRFPDGRIKKGPGGPGRKPYKDDKARTGKLDAAPAKPKAESAPRGVSAPGDYTEVLTGAGQVIWAGLSVIPLPHTGAFAAVWNHQLPALVPAWNTAAQQNASVRDKVEKLQGTGAAWLAPVVMATAPLVGAAVAIITDKDAREQLAAQNKEAFQDWVKATMATAEKADDGAGAA